MRLGIAAQVSREEIGNTTRPSELVGQVEEKLNSLPAVTCRLVGRLGPGLECSGGRGNEPVWRQGVQASRMGLVGLPYGPKSPTLGRCSRMKRKPLPPSRPSVRLSLSQPVKMWESRMATRAGDQRRDDEAQADSQDIDPGPVGGSSGDAHPASLGGFKEQNVRSCW
jgi:hypothetical protein